MTGVWIFIISTLFLQEPASTGAAILVIREYGINVGFINFLWFLATSFDIAVGYGIGVWVRRRFPRSRFVRWAEKEAAYVEEHLGKRGADLSAFLLGFVSIAYINGFLFSWLKISFQRSFTFILLGNAAYWAAAWLLAIGVRSVVDDWRIALVVVIGAGLLLSLILRTWVQHGRRRRSRHG